MRIPLLLAAVIVSCVACERAPRLRPTPGNAGRLAQCAIDTEFLNHSLWVGKWLEDARFNNHCAERLFRKPVAAAGENPT